MKKRIAGIILAWLLVVSQAVSPAYAYTKTLSDSSPEEISADTDGGSVLRGEGDKVCNVDENGIYNLEEGAVCTFVVSEGVSELTIVGNGVEYETDPALDTFGTISSTPNTIRIDASAAPGIHITLCDLYNSIKVHEGNVIDLSGAGNVLTIEGIVLMDYDVDYTTQKNAMIHVGPDTELSVNGAGDLYLYKNSQGALFGGDTGEVNGLILFNMEGNGFFKGTKQGAVIGAGADAASSLTEPDEIRFISGTYNIVANSRGAAIGGSAGNGGASSGTSVFVEERATISINIDYSGAAVGGGGYKNGNDSPGGTLTVTGGSLRPYADKNAVENAAAGWNGRTLSEGVNDALVTADRTNGKVPVYLCAVDISEAEPDGEGNYLVSIDQEENPAYEGGGHRYAYAFDGVDRSDRTQNVSPNSTIGNWIPEIDETLYLWLSGEDHEVTVNGITRTYLFSSEDGTFTKIPPESTEVRFRITPGDARPIVSRGIGYTYTEDRLKTVLTEAADEEDPSAPAVWSAFPTEDGSYTATIIKDGYYASEFSFTIREGEVSSDSNNVKYFLSGNTFEIPLAEFVPSQREGAWDGKTLDVSWYSEEFTELEISTPAQLMGMAAICNGIYNAEITSIIDNAEGELKTYTPAQYAALENRKIRPANSSGYEAGKNENNAVTSETFWYGVKSDGETPADFSGQTVYITEDLDMGGYIKNENAGDYLLKWSGARFMSIGGQSQMHFLAFGQTDTYAAALNEWYFLSDGYSAIGSSFNGVLDGQGHLIKNMYLERCSQGANFGDSQSTGIVGRLGNHDDDPDAWAVKNPTVKNIAAHGYVSGRRSVGGIVGKMGQSLATKGGNLLTDGPVIENCVNFAEIYGTDSKGQGGIAGAGWNAGHITNVVNFGTVYTGYNKTGGGIVGSNESVVTNAYNVGYVSGTMYSAQAIGSRNGGLAKLVNVYWLPGTSTGDTNTSSGTARIRLSAYYDYSAGYDDLTEITSYEELLDEAFPARLNGTGRGWGKAKETDAIYSLLQETAIINDKLSTVGVSAADMPVPRVFVSDAAVVLEVRYDSGPDKLSYVEGQTFDDTGLVITAVWSDGTTEQIKNYNCSVSGVPLTTEIVEVTFDGSFGGIDYSYTLPVTVTGRTLESIRVTAKPDCLVYAKNEAFDAKGMVVRAYFSDKPETGIVISERSEENPDGYTVEVQGSTVTVSYLWNGETETDSFGITFLGISTPLPDEEGWYEIGSSDELVWFANRVNAYSEFALNARVTKDFEADGLFSGIGGKTTAYAYQGIFDGNGHTVTVNLVNTPDSYVGFFRVASGAVIQNLTIAGTAAGTGSTYGISAFVGNVTGNTVTVENCINRADVTGGSQVGSFAGRVYNKASIVITGCINEGTISGVQYVGGIAGYISEGTAGASSVIEMCQNKGDVSASSVYAGGIAGYIQSANSEITAAIRNCGNDGAVMGQKQAGGIIGYSGSGNDLVSGCCNTGMITGTKPEKNTGVGGIAGYAKCAITDSYNIGTVTAGSGSAESGIGGIAGVLHPASGSSQDISNCYNAGPVLNSSEETPGCVGSVFGRQYMNDVRLENTYYLSDGTALYGGSSNTAKTVTGGQKKTAEELKALAPALGEAYRSAPASYHAGYPCLVWEDPGVISLASAKLQYTQTVYSGSAQKPAVTVYAKGSSVPLKNTDYTVTYSNNTNAGQAKVRITGKGVYGGTIDLAFTIRPKAVTPAVTLSAGSYTYNGKARTPGVTVKTGKTTLRKNTDYTVSYASGRKAVGTYKVIVTLKGNYSGKKAASFKIIPKGTSLKTPVSASKALTVKWSKQSAKMNKSRISGYQIQAATNKKFTKNKKSTVVSGYGKTSAAITGLKSGKLYYVRIRTYMKIGKTTYYSEWSKPVSKKTG